MQYINRTNEDLTAGYSTYLLQKTSIGIGFYAYTGNTAIGANKQGQEINSYHRGYFLRKGFSEAINDSDPNVIVPVYKDNENNDVRPLSNDEALNLIYGGKLNISGFEFVDGATQEQKEEAFGKLIDYFVLASKNLDFSSDKNLFIVQGNFHEVAYNNGGSENMKIRGVDVQEKLGLNTQAVKANQIIRAHMMKTCGLGPK